MRYAETYKVLAESLQGLCPDREIDSIGRLVLEHLTGLTWVKIRLNGDNELTEHQVELLQSIILRLRTYEPVQYILGETEFYGLKLRVRKGVLIPRGETEELVQWILQEFAVRKGVPAFAGMTEKGLEPGLPSDSPAFAGITKKDVIDNKRIRILDIGCGSGAIAVALAKNFPDSEVIASDISEDALQVTRENAELNKVDLSTAFLDILGSKPFSVIPTKVGTPSQTAKTFDIIVSNPPYVPLSEMTAMDRHVVEFEPETALFVPDANPLLFYEAIAEFAATNLNPGGEVFVEIHDRLGEKTAAVFHKWFPNVELRKDIHGKDRMIRAYHG